MKDAARAWFEALASMGQNTSGRIGCIREPGGEPTWREAPTERSDGLGAFVELLRDSGHQVEEIPTLKEERKPSLVKVLASWARFMFRRRPRYAWPAAEHKGEGKLPTSVAWHVFDRDETKQLAARPKTVGATVSTLLLDCVSCATRRALGGPSEIAWMLQVNMRGGAGLGDDLVSRSSFLDVSVYDGEPLAALQGRLRRSFARHEHWAAWYLFQVVGLFGAGVVRRLVRQSIDGPSNWVGCFSNMGVWNPPTVGDHPYAWLHCPPPVPSQPIAFGCMTVYGRLTLTLQIHPWIASDPSIARAWLEDAVAEIRGRN